MGRGPQPGAEGRRLGAGQARGPGGPGGPGGPRRITGELSNSDKPLEARVCVVNRRWASLQTGGQERTPRTPAGVTTITPRVVGPAAGAAAHGAMPNPDPDGQQHPQQATLGKAQSTQRTRVIPTSIPIAATTSRDTSLLSEETGPQRGGGRATRHQAPSRPCVRLGVCRSRHDYSRRGRLHRGQAGSAWPVSRSHSSDPDAPAPVPLLWPCPSPQSSLPAWQAGPPVPVMVQASRYPLQRGASSTASLT